MSRRRQRVPRERRQRIGRGARLALVAWLAFALAGCSAPVRVEWATEVELNTAGFDLYRGEVPDGPFDVKVNRELIPASPDPLAGGEYSFVDRTAQAGKTYYYQLHELELSGAVNTYPAVEVTAGWGGWRWALAAGAAALVAVWALARRARRS